MADISKLAKIFDGSLRTEDLSLNTLVVDNLKAKLGGVNEFTFNGTLSASRQITVPDSNVDLGDISKAFDLIGTLLGATDLGTFTGSTIQDNRNVKEALQDLETQLELAASTAYVDAKIEDVILDGETAKAPSQNAVFDALLAKLDSADFSIAFDSVLSTKNSDDISEGSTNLYYTSARQTAIEAYADQVEIDANSYTDSEILTNVTNKLAANNGIATLDSAGKVPVSQLPSAIMEYKGTWDALNNVPTLADGGPPTNALDDVGHVYIVSVAGTRDLGSGNITFNVGDFVILNASLVWEKTASGNVVDSVNGQTGIVVLDSDDISEGSTNLYYTSARQTAIEAYADAKVEDSITNGITAKAPSQNAVYDALATKLDLSGGTLTGILTLSSDPIVNNLQAATKAYVDTEIDALVALNINSLDRWVDPVYGVDAIVSGSKIQPYRTITYALSQITNNSSTNRYTLYLAAADYTAEGTIQHKPWIRLKGAGRNITRLSAIQSVNPANSVQYYLDGLTINGASTYDGSTTTSGIFVISTDVVFGSSTHTFSNPTAATGPQHLARACTFNGPVTVSGRIDAQACWFFGNVTIQDKTSAMIVSLGCYFQGTNISLSGRAQLYSYSSIIGCTGGVIGTAVGANTPIFSFDSTGYSVYGTTGALTLDRHAQSVHVRYTATTPANWGTPTPTTVGAALDAVALKLTGIVSDTALGISWDGVTTIAPSQNAVYDALATKLSLSGGTMTGVLTLSSDPIAADQQAATKKYVDDTVAAASGAVDSVNGQVGVVVLDAADLNYTQADTNDWTVADNSTIAATLDEVGQRLIDLETAGSGDTKQVLISSADTTEGYIQDKIVGATNKITTTKLNSGANEQLQISIGADVFDKITDNSDDVVEGTANRFYTVARQTAIENYADAAVAIETVNRTIALASKQDTITGGATTITGSNLTASRALISNASGKVAVSATTDTEIGFVSGVTSSIQTQINNKVPAPPTSGSAGQFLQTDGAGNTTWADAGSAAPTDTEISSTDIDWAIGDTFYKLISSDTTFTFSNAENGKTIAVILKNTGASDIVLTFPSGILKSGVLNLIIAAGKENIYTFIKSNNKIYVSAITDMA